LSGIKLKDSKKSRRQPTQERSKKRVDAILVASKQLIAEKGSAKLKIHDIAERAGVTPASIYQYFPSKNAIMLALVESVLAVTQSKLLKKTAEIKTMAEACYVMQSLIEDHYQVYLNDPALLDVWMIISADKSLHKLDLEDSRQTSALIMSCIKQFYEEKYWGKISEMSFLLAHMAGAAIRMAIPLGPVEGRSIIDVFKRIINPPTLESMIKLELTLE
jgi:AcrR family transcriptional regulator